ncbi:hypothetical protein F511_32570 [Dorcoceras hygrometricum]|uniref:Uncharacterized protein n=1 Tax=Dorcoceras hygrometricum TaxID=472368 RepID=A0A2Z7AWL9_9LAMI|nr:hypothetical protein F511_32570 [Dorcoceras hygrometricum]
MCVRIFLCRKSCFRHSLHSTSTTMASVFIVNSYQINFESVLMIPDHDGMLNMFKALEANGLRGFLGCESVIYEKELEIFFDTALVQGDDITGAVSGKYFSISQARLTLPPCLPRAAAAAFPRRTCSGHREEEFPSVLISSGLLVQAEEGVSLPVVDLIDESTAAYREETVFL